MKTINANGLAQIKVWLQSQSKGDGWSDENTAAWAEDAEQAMANGNPPIIELKSWQTISGATETFTVSPDGVDNRMTEDEFREFAKSAIWVTKQDSEINDYEVNDGYDNEGCQLSKSRATAYCWKTAEFDGITVKYQDECSWDGNNTQRFGDYDIEPSSNEEWELTGAVIVDEDGDEINRRDVEMVLSQVCDAGHLGEVNQIDHELLIPDMTVTEIDMESDMEEFELDNDNAPSLSFKGEEIGSGSSREHNDTRWTVYRIFRTAGGTLIGQTVGCSQWQGEDTRYKAKVCESEADLIKFLGYSDAAKEAYEEAGIDATVKVK